MAKSTEPTAEERVRLTDDLILCVCVARFCDETGRSVTEVVQLIALARRAFRAGVRHCNTGYNSTPALRRFERYAEALGLEVEWPGLWPHPKLNGKWIELPC